VCGLAASQRIEAALEVIDHGLWIVNRNSERFVL
jgi:hypothetical protein